MKYDGNAIYAAGYDLVWRDEEDESSGQNERADDDQAVGEEPFARKRFLFKEEKGHVYLCFKIIIRIVLSYFYPAKFGFVGEIMKKFVLLPVI
jgi:hypothetical protein